jgi:4-amino-4-deoxy-L-arabinose transferase-like glycosyltransferase
MDKDITNIQAVNQLKLFGFILLSVVIILHIIYLFTAPNLGDEAFYINEINKVRDLGLFTAMAEGFSYLFVVLAIMIDVVVGNEYVSMRLIGLASSIGIFIACFSVFNLLKIDLQYKSIFILTISYILTMNVEFFQGMSDRLMVLLVLLGFIYYFHYYFNKENIKYLWMSGVFLGLSLWVRSFSLIFLLGFSLFFVFLFFTQKKEGVFTFVKNGFLWGIIIIIVAFVPQMPSLITNKNLAFEDKNTPEHNWAVRNWFTHIERKNTNSIFYYQRVSWERMDSLIIQSGGIENIPVSIPEQCKEDPKFFVDNILSNIFRLLFFVVYGIGLLGILSLDYLRKPEQIIKYYKEPPNIIIISCLIVICITGMALSVIIINYIEWRWFTLPLLLLSVLGIYKLNRITNDNYKRNVIILQYIFLIAMLVNIIRSLSNNIIAIF